MTLTSPPSSFLRSTDDDDRCRLRVARDVAEIAVAWRALEAVGVTTPFQSFAFVSAWIASKAEGGRPWIVTGWTGERLDFVLPLEIHSRGGLSVARWIGGSHAGYKFGLWRRDAVPDGRKLAALIRTAGRDEGIDLFVLDAMPLTWDGLHLPLATAFEFHDALDDGHRFALPASFDELIAARNSGHKRKKIKQKERLLHAAGNYSIAPAEGSEETRAVLAAFFEQKAASLAVRGIADPFAAQGVRDFYQALATASGERPPLLELTRLSAGGAIRAVLGSIVWGETSHQLFVSVAHDELSRASPGETLFFRHIEATCGQGPTTYDMGVGSERYKASWCDELVPLVSAVVPIGTKGRIAGAAYSAANRLKARVRRDAALWTKVKNLRARILGHDPRSSED